MPRPPGDRDHASVQGRSSDVATTGLFPFADRNRQRPAVAPRSGLPWPKDVSSTLPDRDIVDLGTFTPQHTFLDIPAGSISPTAGLVWDVQAVLAIGGTADDGAVTAFLVGEPALGYIGQSAPIGPTFGEARLEVSTSQISGTLLHLYVFTNVVPTADSASGYLVATPRGLT